MNLFFFFFGLILIFCWDFCIDIDGQGDMKLICGTTAAEKRAKQGREGKVTKLNNIPYDSVSSHNFGAIN